MSGNGNPTQKATLYTVEKYARERVLVDDASYLGSKVYLMNTMFELDITELRQKLKTYRKNATSKISLPTALFYCYAQTLDKQKRAHALKSSRNRLFVFNEADVFFPFEVTVGEQKMIARKIIRAANTKSIHQLEAEIAQLSNVKTVQMCWHERLYLSLPKAIRNIGYSILMGIPIKRKELFGNVYFSTALTLGTDKITAQSIPCHFHSIGMFISPCKMVNDATNQIRSTIGVTVSADHAIINGVDLARFCKEFMKQIDELRF